MKLQALATLTAVVERGSLAAAAEAVNLTPSAVSVQMKQLEAWFGQPLFDRSGRQVRPTPFALQLARTLERAISDIEALRQLRSPRAVEGRVRLGLTESVQTTLLPPAFAELQRAAPGVQLRLSRGASPALLQDLSAGRIDAAVLIRPPTGGSNRLAWTDLFEEPMVLVVPAGMAGASPARLLAQHPWLRLDRSLIAGRMAARHVDALVPQRQPLIDVPGVDAIVAMVASGLGISVLPRLRPDQRAAHAVREVSLGPQGPRRVVTLVRRAADAEHGPIDAVQAAFVLAARAMR